MLVDGMIGFVETDIPAMTDVALRIVERQRRISRNVQCTGSLEPQQITPPSSPFRPFDRRPAVTDMTMISKLRDIFRANPGRPRLSPVESGGQMRK